MRRVLVVLVAGGLAVVGLMVSTRMLPAVAASSGISVQQVTAVRNADHRRVGGADPGFAKFGSGYYLFSTGARFPALRAASPNGPWHGIGRAMTRRAGWWASSSKEWAPDVFRIGGKYVMYYTAVRQGSSIHCLGVAVSSTPGTGYVPKGGPICSSAFGSGYERIDPAHFVAGNGVPYLVFKEDLRNQSGFRIRAVQMDASGTAVASGAQPFNLVPSSGTMSSRMEAPSLIAHGDAVYLFTSRGDYLDCSYSTDVWKASSLRGTFTRVKEVLGDRSLPACGPGGASVIQDGATTRIAFHEYVSATGKGAYRAPSVGVVSWGTGGGGTPRPAGDTGLGMMPGTSPSIARLSGGGTEVAFQANTGHLWTIGPDGRHDWGLGMAGGTSPSITALSGGRYLVAFQANTGSLFLLNSGTRTARDLGQGMAGNTSPAIATVGTDGHEIAFQANTGSLVTVGTAENKNWGLGMLGGTSPAITRYGAHGYQVAFQANTSSLWTVGTAGNKNWGLGMMSGTSPAIAKVSGGFEAAFQANSGHLWTVGAAGNTDWPLGMAGGTSPAITRTSTGKYRVAFQANTTSLWVVRPDGGTDRKLGMAGSTSPSLVMAGSTPTLSFQANSGHLWRVH